MLVNNHLGITFILSILFILINYKIFKVLQETLSIEKNIAKIIFFTHLFFSMCFLINDFFSLFGISPGSDATGYYFNAYDEIFFNNIDFIVGRGHERFIYFVYYLKKLHIDFFSLNFLFGILGSTSILIYYSCISRYFSDKYDKFIILIFVLLPSFNYWSSGITKDVLGIFAISLLILSYIKNSIYIFICSLFILILFKIYLGLIVIITMALSLILIGSYNLIFKKTNILFNKKIDIKILLIIITLFFLGIIIGKVFFFKDITNIINTIIQFQNMYPGENFINQKNFFLRIFEYIGRPFITENKNLFFTIFSIEGIYIYIVLTFLTLRIIFNKNFAIKNYKIDHKFFIIVSFFAIGCFQILITSNIGIALRQKWIFLPGIIFSLIYYRNLLLNKSRYK